MGDGEMMDGVRRRIVRVRPVPLSALPRRSSDEKSAIHGWRKKALRRQTHSAERQRLLGSVESTLNKCCSVEGQGGGQEDAQLLARQRAEHHRRDVQPMPCPHEHL